MTTCFCRFSKLFTFKGHLLNKNLHTSSVFLLYPKEEIKISKFNYNINGSSHTNLSLNSCFKSFCRKCPVASSILSQPQSPLVRHFHLGNVHYFQEDKKTKALTVLDNVKQVRDSPAAALILGFGGLIPFVAAPSYIISLGVFVPSIAFAQVAYGASILSFIGGIRWGLTLPEGSSQSPDWHNLGYSITPSLIAWGALLASPTVGSLVLMGGLGLAGYMDIAMWGYPNWFKGMRFCLTFVAILSIWTTLMCSFIMDSSPKEKTQEGVRNS